MSSLEIVAVATSFAAIWLTTRRHMLCWPVNIAACALYGKLFADVRLYADMALQAVFAASAIYGWYAWAQGTDARGDVVVRSLPVREGAVSIAAGAAGAAAIGWGMSRYTNASLPGMDASLSSFSLVAQYWTARRYPASWVLWIALDVVYVGMFLFKGLLLTAGLYAGIAVLAVLGLVRWRKAQEYVLF